MTVADDVALCLLRITILAALTAVICVPAHCELFLPYAAVKNPDVLVQRRSIQALVSRTNNSVEDWKRISRFLATNSPNSLIEWSFLELATSATTGASGSKVISSLVELLETRPTKAVRRALLLSVARVGHVPQVKAQELMARLTSDPLSAEDKTLVETALLLGATPSESPKAIDIPFEHLDSSSLTQVVHLLSVAGRPMTLSERGIGYLLSKAMDPSMFSGEVVCGLIRCGVRSDTFISQVRSLITRSDDPDSTMVFRPIFYYALAALQSSEASSMVEKALGQYGDILTADRADMLTMGQIASAIVEDKVVSVTIEQLDSSDSRVRSGTMRFLSVIGLRASAASPKLLRIMASGEFNSLERSSAAEVIASVGKPDVLPALRKWVEQKSTRAGVSASENAIRIIQESEE